LPRSDYGVSGSQAVTLTRIVTGFRNRTMSPLLDDIYPPAGVLPGARLQLAFSKPAQQRVMRVILLLSDGFMLALAFMLAYWLRFDLDFTLAPEVQPSPLFYQQLLLFLLPLWLLFFAVFGLYHLENLLGGTTEYARVFNALAVGMMVVVVFTFILPTFVVARGWLIAAWLLSILLVCSARFVVRRTIYHLRERGYFVSPAAIVGANDEALQLARQLRAWRTSGLHVVGFVDSSQASTESSPLPNLGSISEIEAIVSRHGIEELIVASSSLSRSELLELFERVSPLQQVELRMSSGLFEVLATGVRVRSAGDVPLMSFNKLRLDPLEATLKSLLDYSLTLVGLLLLSPLLLLIALLIRLDSPGPILYRRRVLGVGGRQFDAFKFRTMYLNGDQILTQHPELLEELRTTHKLKRDPRVTRVGNWLRKYSLDEFPQLLNVLFGQMSLVGPRMISPAEADQYGKLRMNLLTVKPGITGLWQVSGRSDISYDERVRLDTHYIRHYSIWQDLQILFIQTLPAVIAGRGAY
jgi:exopolysaccharide biosynthesis polyprenyl glycosylphosphotransferase